MDIDKVYSVCKCWWEFEYRVYVCGIVSVNGVWT